MNESSRMEALLIGIDAGCFPVFDRLIQEGRIPHLERLVDDGIGVPLTSQIPPWTPSAWPSLFTGVNPGKHGVTGFVAYDGYDWRVVTYDDVEAHALWDLLGYHDRTSVIVNVPVTHPPTAFDGAIIPGFIGAENPACHPPGILDDVRTAIGEYRVYPAYTRDSDDLTDAEKIREYEALVRMRGEAFRYLADRYDPEFGFVQFQKTDTVFHEFNGDESKVNTVYEAVDREIGLLLDQCDPQRVFVASDHGIGRYRGYEFRVNEYLHDEGFVETTTSGKGMPSWNPIRTELRDGRAVTEWEPSRAERAAAVAARFGLTARRARIILEKLRVYDVVKRVVPSNVARTANLQVDFQRSAAYLRTRTELGIRINLAGRDPDGVVPPEEYEAVRDELIAKLRTVTTPDGDRVFEEVTRRERYFSGKNIENTADIVIIPNQMSYFLSEQIGDGNGVFVDATAEWDHKMDGVFVAAGTGINTDLNIQDAHLFDVAPTIMAALGLPYSDEMDGRVLPIVDDPGPQSYPAYEDVRARAARGLLRAGEDEAVERRLESLGYL